MRLGKIGRDRLGRGGLPTIPSKSCLFTSPSFGPVTRKILLAAAAQIPDLVMDRAFPRMGRVRTTDQVLQMIKGAGGKEG